MSTNPNDPISPCLFQRIGDNEVRPNKPGDAKEWNIPMGGLTIRQYFSAMAMSGYMAYEFAQHMNAQDVAEYAVKCADALIDELNKPKP